MSELHRLNRQLQLAHERLHQLQQQAIASTEQSPQTSEVISTIASLLAELQNTTQELHQQNEAILVTRQVLEERQCYQNGLNAAPDASPDITQLKHSKADRQQSKLGLQEITTALSNALEGISRLDEQGRYIFVNEAYARVAGYTSVELMGMSWQRTVHPDDLERVMAGYWQMVSQGRVELEVRGIRQNGVVFYKQLFMVAVYNEQQQFTGHYCFIKDITDRKRREANLVFLAEIAEDCSHLSSAEEIMQTVGAKVGTYFGISNCLLAEINEARDEATVEYIWHKVDMSNMISVYRLSDFITEELQPIARAGEAIVVCNTQTDPRLNKERYATFKIHAFVTVPFHDSGKWTYLFTLVDAVAREWREDEIELIREVTSCIFPRLERARTEVALRENEQMLRLAMAGAQAGFWHWEIATGKLTWSLENYHLHGIDPATAPPQYDGWYATLLHPDDRTWVHAHLLQVLERRLPDLHIEFRILHPQRGTRWLLGLGHLTLNEQGEPMRLSGINLDITDRKLTEQKIREQAALLDITSDAIFVHDLSYRILYWNRGAEQLYGWSAAEAIGQTAHELLRSDAIPTPAMIETLFSRGEWRGEVHNITKTGKAVIVEAHWTLVRDDTNQPKSIFSVDTDITEKKQLEAQFYRAQRLESLGTLASGIAHDLNNVLTPIVAISQLLRKHQSTLDARSLEMLQLLEESAKRGTNMVKRILTFTRGRGGERSVVQLTFVLKELIKVLLRTLPETIVIRENIPADFPCFVSADSTYLHQVFMNLCVNARDAMPNGGILSLSVEHCFVDQTFAQTNLHARIGDYVVVTIADTGTGISPEVRDRIFDPFFTTKALGQGTGLGLAITLEIVKNYDGFLQVFSEIGRGTQVKVYLPHHKVT